MNNIFFFSSDNYVTPTPISTLPLYYHSPMCVALKGIELCSDYVPDGTRLIYQSMPQFDCNHNHMLFVHGVDGTITHKCSGKKVCPNAHKQLVVSNQCDGDSAKFLRTKV